MFGAALMAKGERETETLASEAESLTSVVWHPKWKRISLKLGRKSADSPGHRSFGVVV